MLFRMKRIHYTGYTKAGVYKKHEKPIPGCREYEKRLELYENRATIRDDRREELMSAISGNLTRNCPPILRLTLKHGDMVVMHGDDIQKYFEVSSNPDSGKPKLLT